MAHSVDHLFTDELWACISPGVIDKIKEHPFITGLVDGSLKDDIFRDYIVQDHKYLHTYARNLNTLASKAHEPRHAKVFTRSAMTIYMDELSLHSKLLQQWSLDEAAVEAVEMQPPCFMYTHFLSSVATSRPFHEGVAAVLPCYWIYQHVGQYLKGKGLQNPRYQSWIEVYGGEEFDKTVCEVLDMMNEIAALLTGEQKEACKRQFLSASRMEFMFWDGPFRGFTWPC